MAMGHTLASLEFLGHREDAKVTPEDSSSNESSVYSHSKEVADHGIPSERVEQVAFSASLRSSGETVGPFSSHTPLAYRHVITNIGCAYNPNTGVFTAPVRGAYHFEFYFGAFGPSHAALLLMKNGENVVGGAEQQTDHFGTGANAATLLLEPGDTVFMRLVGNSSVYDNENHHTTFSGHLLFTM